MSEDSASQRPQVFSSYTRYVPIITFTISYSTSIYIFLYLFSCIYYDGTSAAHFNEVGQQVVIAADEVGVVQLVQPLGVRRDMVQTHRSPLAGVAFSTCFNHLLSASRDGVSGS